MNNEKLNMSLERESFSLKERKPYFVYLAEAHQTRMGKIIDARPFLTLASSSLEALGAARFKARGVKKHKLLEIRETSKEEFKKKAEELLESGISLPDEILSYTQLQNRGQKEG